MRVLQYFNSFSHSLTCTDIDSSLVRCSINFRHYEVITRTLEGTDSAANFIFHHFTVIYNIIHYIYTYSKLVDFLHVTTLQQ